MADLFMRFPGGKEKALTFSYDDGIEQDRRLVEILNQNGLKGTFNLNSGLYAPEGTVYPRGQIHRRMTKQQVTELFADSGHEVAVHALTHPGLERLPVHVAMQELLQDRINLESQFHTIVRGMAYPYGTFNDEVADCVQKAGLSYARTVISSHSFGLPKDWLRLEATCHHNDPKLMELAHTFTEEKPQWDPWLFYVWGHSYEFEERDNWQVMEEFAALVGGRKDIWYATNLQIFDYIQAYGRMEFSADGSMVCNPTAKDVWFCREGRLICLKAGEKMTLE